MRNGEATLRHLLAPIQAHLDDQQVTEIVCQRPGEAGIERGGKWSWLDVPAFDFMRLDAIGILAGSLLSKPFDPYNPICMTTLPDGQRCTLCRQPVTAPGTISMTIRIPSKSVHTVRDPDFDQLLRSKPVGGTQTDQQLVSLYRAQNWTEFFSLAVKSRKTIVATGAVGSGKTSLLRRLMREIPLNDRIVTIEDTDEFGVLPQRNRVSLFYGAAAITAEKAVEASLRMRPDRIAMQELRGAEAFAYIRALASGHPGGLTTWHAEEGDPFTPLALMAAGSDAGGKIPSDKLLAILRRFIDIVAFCRRDGTVFSVPSVWFRSAEETEQVEFAA